MKLNPLTTTMRIFSKHLLMFITNLPQGIHIKILISFCGFMVKEMVFILSEDSILRDVICKRYAQKE